MNEDMERPFKIENSGALLAKLRTQLDEFYKEINAVHKKIKQIERNRSKCPRNKLLNSDGFKKEIEALRQCIKDLEKEKNDFLSEVLLFVTATAPASAPAVKTPKN